MGRSRALKTVAVVVNGNVAVGAHKVLPTGKKLDDFVPDLPRMTPAPRPVTQNKKLYNIIEQIWKHAGDDGTVGDGTTFDAIRNEILTGRPSGNKTHAIKAKELTNGLINFLKRRDVAPADRALAEDLLRQLQEAQKEEER